MEHSRQGEEHDYEEVGGKTYLIYKDTNGTHCRRFRKGLGVHFRPPLARSEESFVFETFFPNFFKAMASNLQPTTSSNGLQINMAQGFDGGFWRESLSQKLDSRGLGCLMIFGRALRTQETRETACLPVFFLKTHFFVVLFDWANFGLWFRRVGRICLDFFARKDLLHVHDFFFMRFISFGRCFRHSLFRKLPVLLGSSVT